MSTSGETALVQPTSTSTSAPWLAHPAPGPGSLRCHLPPHRSTLPVATSRLSTTRWRSTLLTPTPPTMPPAQRSCNIPEGDQRGTHHCNPRRVWLAGRRHVRDLLEHAAALHATRPDRVGGDRDRLRRLEHLNRLRHHRRSNRVHRRITPSVAAKIVGDAAVGFPCRPVPHSPDPRNLPPVELERVPGGRFRRSRG